MKINASNVFAYEVTVNRHKSVCKVLTETTLLRNALGYVVGPAVC